MTDAMLIVCPSCATSYQIDPESVGSAGRMVRCARCKTTWFASPTAEVDSFVDGVIAEAEADQIRGVLRDRTPRESTPDDFGLPEDAPLPEPAAGEPPAIEATPSFTAAAEFTPPPAPSSFDIEPQPEPPPATIADAPSLVPPVAPPIEQPVYQETTTAEREEQLETFAARRKRMQTKRKQSRRSSRWTAVILVLFAVNVALIGGRNEVVRFLPQTASLFAAIGLPVNLRQLAFDNVRITRESQDGATILMVEGYIVSTASKPVEVPRLRFAARNKDGQEIYTWTAKPERSILEPGQRLQFSSRLASPPADANDVMVRFFTANDAMAGNMAGKK
ncbi:zinc-ribbon domain-containing protein [Microbacteriaceae bacterium K1510]|nr:zinc-ribbon domain-containing protein [Microbacteriaceae bacterium K1510]